MILDNLYSFWVRPSSEKEVLQGNNDRMIFINSNFTLFYCDDQEQKLDLISGANNQKLISADISAFRPIDQESGDVLQQIKFLNVGFSNYNLTKAYEESEGKILNFHCEVDQLFVLVEKFNGTFLKYFSVEGHDATFQKEI